MCGSIPQDPSSHALIQTFVSSPALCFLSLFRLLSPLFSRVTCESVLTAWGVWQQQPPPPCTGAHSISARFSADSIPSQQRPASQHGSEPTPTKTRLQSAVHQSPLQADDDQGAIDAVLRRRCQKGRRCGGALAVQAKRAAVASSQEVLVAVLKKSGAGGGAGTSVGAEAWHMHVDTKSPEFCGLMTACTL